MWKTAQRTRVILPRLGATGSPLRGGGLPARVHWRTSRQWHPEEPPPVRALILGGLAILSVTCGTGLQPVEVTGYKPVPHVEVVGIDGSTLSCSFVGASDQTVVLECPQRIEMPVDELYSMTFASVTSQPPGTTHTTTFFLADGGHIRGALTASPQGTASPRGTAEGDEAVIADTSIGSGLTLPLASLAGIWFGGSHRLQTGATRDRESKGRKLFDELMADRLTGKDILLVERDGELSTIRGGLLSIGPLRGGGSAGGRFMFNRKERSFKLDTVLAIVLATGAGEDVNWPVTVRLADGGVFDARWLQAESSADGSMVFATSIGAELAVPMNKLSSLRFRSERVVYLSDLRPARNRATGFLHEASPARFDRSVSNGPLVIDHTTFERGIGVQSYSELTYRIDGAYTLFAATIGIDDAARPRGDVVFRVEGDSKVLFDSGPVTGRDVARRVTADVTGVKELSLIVDFGSGLDLSDHANWADARLIRPPPRRGVPHGNLRR